MRLFFNKKGLTVWQGRLHTAALLLGLLCGMVSAFSWWLALLLLFVCGLGYLAARIYLPLAFRRQTLFLQNGALWLEQGLFFRRLIRFPLSAVTWRSQFSTPWMKRQGCCELLLFSGRQSLFLSPLSLETGAFLLGQEEVSHGI